ncbi:hypothetical protein VTI28DRAFT_2830 [Corynascus sepedonium]
MGCPASVHQPHRTKSYLSNPLRRVWTLLPGLGARLPVSDEPRHKRNVPSRLRFEKEGMLAQRRRQDSSALRVLAQTHTVHGILAALPQGCLTLIRTCSGSLTASGRWHWVPLLDLVPCRPAASSPVCVCLARCQGGELGKPDAAPNTGPGEISVPPKQL